MSWPAGPDCSRRAHASCEDSNSPRAAGIVRVRIAFIRARVEDEKIVAIGFEVRIEFRESRHLIHKETDAVGVAGGDQRREVTIRSGIGISGGKPQLEIRRAVIGCAVTPLAIVDTVGRRKQFQRIHADLRQVGTAQTRHVQIVKIFALHVGIDERNHIPKRADAHVAPAHLSGAHPGGGQFVNDDAVVGRQRVGSRFIRKSIPGVLVRR